MLCEFFFVLVMKVGMMNDGSDGSDDAVRLFQWIRSLSYTYLLRQLTVQYVWMVSLFITSLECRLTGE